MPDTSAQALTQTRLRVASIFRLVGWVGFWLELALGIGAGVILLFAGERERLNHPGTTFGLGLASLALIILAVGVLAKLLDVRAARQLRSPDAKQWPSKRTLVRLGDLKTGLHLFGMLVALGAIESIIIALATVAMTLVPGIINDPSRTIQPLDLLVIQGLVFIIAAHFVGAGTSLVTLRGLLLADPHDRHLEPRQKPQLPHRPRELPEDLPARQRHSRQLRGEEGYGESDRPTESPRAPRDRYPDLPPDISTDDEFDSNDEFDSSDEFDDRE
ncbi:MAG: DUF3611 family protein [Cyanobacteria bacterium J06648_11]